MSNHPIFVCLETIPSSRGMISVVELDRKTDDFGHLVNQEITLDGKNYICRGVERFTHSPPYRIGERIGLLLDEKLE